MSLFFETPIIIVGQGLAGSLLAWTLLQQGKDVHIFAGDKACASQVAAGLINPVTGQRFVLADNTPEMLTYASKFYQDIETRLNIQCFHEKPMFRLFSSQKEHENCEKRLKNEKYDAFLDNTPPPKSLLAEHGGIIQNHTAWLDTNILLDALHTYFEQLNIITCRNFEAENTEQHVIYCEGYHMMFNPLFSWLPLQPAHGEIITCDCKQTLPDAIINKGKWLLPTSQNTCRIGATFGTKMTTPTLLETSKQQLLTFAEGVFSEKHDFNVVEHQAGIRPTTLDKQPFIGTHPKHQNIFILNGFGSRGSLMIPWYAKQFSESNISEEADIKRYAHLCV